MLPKTAEYALRAIACLAGNADCAFSAESLAEQTKVPRRYLHKVLQDLVQAELVQSRPGPGGGYSLATDADTLTILDVVNAVAPLERIRHCPLGLPSHTRLCPVHRELDKAYAATEAAFRRVTIGELLRSNDDIIPLCDARKALTCHDLSCLEESKHAKALEITPATGGPRPSVVNTDNFSR
ncbi:MAG: Rrf2 family transcriptional regulator [Planctomycetaceae bacterium]|nr:Rrf2 family transcriptional regulator [Planctomycetaceae bacterium]MCB9952674.1 Rrf2 family transcriptional regulator [Planctomycetaceae bacterium]